MKQLRKEESRRRWRELREIINRWDPIGVFKMDSARPKDESECVAGPVMRMLEAGRSVDEITQYLEEEVREHVGLESVHGAAAHCATEAIKWFRREWSR